MQIYYYISTQSVFSLEQEFNFIFNQNLKRILSFYTTYHSAVTKLISKNIKHSQKCIKYKNSNINLEMNKDNSKNHIVNCCVRALVLFICKYIFN